MTQVIMSLVLYNYKFAMVRLVLLNFFNEKSLEKPYLCYELMTNFHLNLLRQIRL